MRVSVLRGTEKEMILQGIVLVDEFTKEVEAVLVEVEELAKTAQRVRGAFAKFALLSGAGMENESNQTKGEKNDNK